MSPFRHPATVKVDTAGFYLVTFPDVPEAGTDANTREEALREAVDALIAALGGYVHARRPIPKPSKAKPGQAMITLPFASGLNQNAEQHGVAHPQIPGGFSSYTFVHQE